MLSCGKLKATLPFFPQCFCLAVGFVHLCLCNTHSASESAVGLRLQRQRLGSEGAVPCCHWPVVAGLCLIDERPAVPQWRIFHPPLSLPSSDTNAYIPFRCVQGPSGKHGATSRRASRRTGSGGRHSGWTHGHRRPPACYPFHPHHFTKPSVHSSVRPSVQELSSLRDGRVAGLAVPKDPANSECRVSQCRIGRGVRGARAGNSALSGAAAAAPRAAPPLHRASSPSGDPPP